jgi:hypothetical protein
MKRGNWFVAIMAITVAAALSWADMSFAQQGQGRGVGRRGQGGQGYGPGYANCPNYPAYRNCRRVADGAPVQTRRGRRGNQAVNPPGPPVAAPDTAQ